MSLFKAFWFRIFCCLLCCGVIASTGCRDSFLFKPAQAVSEPSFEAKNQYRQALAAYMGGDYPYAAEQFEAVRLQTTDKRFALMALYGAACSRLMVANTPQEYNDAMLLWEKWVKHVPDTCKYENSALFDPLIKEKMIFSNIPLTPEKHGDVEAKASVPQWLLIKSKEELDRMKAELDMAQQSLEKRQKKILGLEKEIEALQGQIKALETIDQKIQKKKNAIPTTDSPGNGELK